MNDIMTIEEVAEYLRVSERTVYDWAQKGTIPGGKLGTTWRFKRQDVEKWVDKQLSGEKESRKIKADKGVLVPERIMIAEKTDKKSVLTGLVDLLAQSPAVQDRDALLEGIFAREKLMSTGIGFGVGVPHVRIDCVSDLVMAAAVCRQGVEDYGSLDGEPVRIVCMLAARSDQHTKYIRALSSISGRLKHAAIRSRIIESTDQQFIFQQLTAEDLLHA